MYEPLVTPSRNTRFQQLSLIHNLLFRKVMRFTENLWLVNGRIAQWIEQLTD